MKLVWDSDTELEERDQRWEDMYAAIAPYTVVLNGELVNVVKIGFYVRWQGGYYWTEQNLLKDDIEEFIEFDIMSWLLDEMVKIMDGYLDAGITKE
jgi:hypothetical protein